LLSSRILYHILPLTILSTIFCYDLVKDPETAAGLAGYFHGTRRGKKALTREIQKSKIPKQRELVPQLI